MIVRVSNRGLGGTAEAGVTIGTSAGQGFMTGGPVGGAIGAVVGVIRAWLSRAGPHQNVATTMIVDQAEPLLKQNLAAWQASTKTASEQAAALANFDAVWASVVNACAQPQLGDPGHSCIDDRMPVGMNFSYNTFHLVGNGMYDWFAWYRDPIANDPNVIDDSVAAALGVGPAGASGVLASIGSGLPVGSSGSLLPVFLLAGVALTLWVVLS